MLPFGLATVCAEETNVPRVQCVYEAATRQLQVTTVQGRRFRFGFNPGGAICSVRDLDLAPEVEIIGDAFQGETTDRVIQWTYWNGRYLAQAHQAGDGDRRANVTMEGCYHGREVCEVLETPASGDAMELTFRSRITHWFYAELDRHGRPDFETISRYQVLADGSLRLERSVVRRPWVLKNVTARTWQPRLQSWLDGVQDEVRLEARHLWPASMTSYFEAWTPLRRSALPEVRHEKGVLEKGGYLFWLPQDMGGWAMAYGETLAFGVIFGTVQPACPPHALRSVFNTMHLPEHNLTLLLPGIELDWPDDATLVQTLVFAVGSPPEVEARARRLAPEVPAAQLRVKLPSK
jgi:hypothetical protein